MTNLSEADRSRMYAEMSAATSPGTAENLMRGVFDVQWEDVATRADLADLRGNFAGLQGEFAGLKGEFTGLQGEFAGLKGEFAQLRGEFAELRGEFTDLRAEMRIGFAQMDAKMEQQFRQHLNRTMTLMIALFSLLGGLIIALH